MRRHICVCAAGLVCVWSSFLSAQAKGTKDHPISAVVHGTLNVVLANGNGIVAATDSIATVTGSGGSHQTLLPNQKVFKVDDTTVCTIAGFASSSWSPFRGATTDISSIIYSFSRRLRNEQLRGKPPIPFRFKLIALERMITAHLQVLAAAASINRWKRSFQEKKSEAMTSMPPVMNMTAEPIGSTVMDVSFIRRKSRPDIVVSGDASRENVPIQDEPSAS